MPLPSESPLWCFLVLGDGQFSGHYVRREVQSESVYQKVDKDISILTITIGKVFLCHKIHLVRWFARHLAVSISNCICNFNFSLLVISPIFGNIRDPSDGTRVFYNKFC